MLGRLNSLEFAFVDCGANFGYWSVFVSSPEMKSRIVVSIEASPKTFAFLEENARINHHRFKPVHLAISSEAGQEVIIDQTRGHADASIQLDESPHANGAKVFTTTLDEIVSRYFPAAPDSLLIKLDVEGQEINAFKGCRRTLESRDILFYYEDHGQDTGSGPTRFVLESLGLLVFFCHNDGTIQAIKNAGDASNLKTRKSVGYNFFACKANSKFRQLFL